MWWVWHACKEGFNHHTTKQTSKIQPTISWAILLSSLHTISIQQKKTKDNSSIANDDNHEQEVVASNQHWILVPKGMNCTQRYPVDYTYAWGMLIMHKPWNKHNTLEHILNNKMATIDTFLRMIDRKEVPSSVMFQYLTAMKYAWQKKFKYMLRKVSTIQILMKKILMKKH
jgi:hypothetical protein